MTSNIGSHFLIDGIGADGQITEAAREEVMRDLRSAFRPEFLNRVDEVVLFKPLQRDEVYDIIKQSIKEVERKLEDREIKIEVTDSALEFILNASFSPQYGARSVKRYIGHTLETKISKMIIRGDVMDGDTILVDVYADDLSVKVK